MKKVCLFMSLMLGALFCIAEAAPTPQTKQNGTNSAQVDEKFNIMFRDEVEDTDTLAIPLDDSEIEDEEEIDYAEKSDVFHLPQSR